MYGTLISHPGRQMESFVEGGGEHRQNKYEKKIFKKKKEISKIRSCFSMFHLRATCLFSPHTPPIINVLCFITKITLFYRPFNRKTWNFTSIVSSRFLGVEFWYAILGVNCLLESQCSWVANIGAKIVSQAPKPTSRPKIEVRYQKLMTRNLNRNSKG